jgi:hypothetical protein
MNDVLAMVTSSHGQRWAVMFVVDTLHWDLL